MTPGEDTGSARLTMPVLLISPFPWMTTVLMEDAKFSWITSVSVMSTNILVDAAVVIVAVTTKMILMELS